jgi:inhibitor of cysteine peptidase
MDFGKLMNLINLALFVALLAACWSPAPTPSPTAMVTRVQPTVAPTLTIAPTAIASTPSSIPTSTKGTMRLTNTDTGKKIDLALGEVLEIAFETSTIEGYEWQVMTVNSAVLKQMGDPVFTRQSNAMGNPGVQVWKFQAVNAGNTLLKLGYAQWFNKTVPNPTFEVTVNVK